MSLRKSDNEATHFFAPALATCSSTHDGARNEKQQESQYLYVPLHSTTHDQTRPLDLLPLCNPLTMPRITYHSLVKRISSAHRVSLRVMHISTGTQTPICCFAMRLACHVMDKTMRSFFVSNKREQIHGILRGAPKAVA